MADRTPTLLSALDDDRLGAALSELGRSIAVPAPDRLAGAVRLELEEQQPVRPSRSWTGRLRASDLYPKRRAIRLALVLALVALAVAAAVAGAGLLGLPGLRFFFEPGALPTPSASVASQPSPSAAPSSRASMTPGAGLGLGASLPVGSIDERAGFHVPVPDDPALGPPDAAYLDRTLGSGQVALVWAADDDLAPITGGSDVGLVLTQAQGSLEEGYFAKLIGAGTKLTVADVEGATAYWIEGDPHFFFYVGPDGRSVDDPRRVVGDTLVFERDGRIVRIETSAGLERALDVARSLP